MYNKAVNYQNENTSCYKAGTSITVKKGQVVCKAYPIVTVFCLVDEGTLVNF